jgi:hypothetical protein
MLANLRFPLALTVGSLLLATACAKGPPDDIEAPASNRSDAGTASTGGSSGSGQGGGPTSGVSSGTGGAPGPSRDTVADVPRDAAISSPADAVAEPGDSAPTKADAPLNCRTGEHVCGASCVSDNDVATCGSSCNAPCPTPGDLGLATCDGRTCGIACAAPALACGTQSCQPLRWDFEAGTQEWVAAPLNSRAARGPLGANAGRTTGRALAQELNVSGAGRNLQLIVPLCSRGGSLDLHGRTVTAALYLDGPPLPGDAGPHMVGVVYETTTRSSTISAFMNVVSKNTLNLRATLPDNAQEVIKLGISLYINGTTDWSGTAYLDDVAVE